MLQVGDQLVGRYEIEALLGEGGMGAVFRAFDTLKQRKVAVKEFRLGDLPSEKDLVTGPDVTRGKRKTPAQLTREDALKLFKKEAHLLSSLQHPNLPEVFDFFILGSEGYIVMTLIEGRSLTDALEENGGPLSEETLTGWLKQVLEALQYCHSKGVIHRDLKPDNLLLTDDGQVYLIDFGIAKALNPGQRATSTGARILSPGYAPPEQYSAREGGIDPCSDLYSLGSVAYTLLTGEVPPEATDRMAGEKLPVPRTLNPTISGRMENFILHCLEMDKENRPQNVEEAIRLLLGDGSSQIGPQSATSKQTAKLPLQKPRTAPVAPLPKSARRQQLHIRWRIVTTAAGSLVLLGLLIWLLGWKIIPPMLQNDRNDQATQKAIVVIQTESTRLATIAAAWTKTPTPTQTPANTSTFTITPTLTLIPPDCTQKGQIWTSPIDGMVLVCVPAGEFTMGSTIGLDDEKPEHAVFMNAYWIDQTEVTNTKYAQCVADGDCSKPSITSSISQDDYYGNSKYSRYPVINIDWQQAADYCEWAGRALPTEAQWEKAARGSDGFTYPWGNNPPNSTLANYGEIIGDTTEVGSYPDAKSPYGALDMAGNVWEWVADWYETYSSNFQSNPIGPASGDYRVLRGGSWYGDLFLARVSTRYYNYPDHKNYDIGFRCVLSLGF